MRILIAEDQKDLNKILVKKLTAEGYSVDTAFDGEEALDFIRMADYDGMILDINMPRKNGLEVVETIRKNGNYTPVLFLTARDSIEDKVTGLDIGANDYLVKPFSFEELMARVRALTRKTAESNTPIYCLCDLTLNSSSHTVTRGGQDIKLSAKEFPCWNTFSAVREKLLPVKTLKTIFGTSIMRAAPMQSMFTSATCERKLMKTSNRS